MKRRSRKRAKAELRSAFVRGFVATTLVSSIEAHRSGEAGQVWSVLRKGATAAIAVAAGTAAASGLEERRYGAALIAVLAGGTLLAITGSGAAAGNTEGVS